MSSSSDGESPVIEQGPFRRFISGEVLRYQAGRAVVLSGPRGYRVATAEEPLDFLARFLDSFTHYCIVDTTARSTTRKSLQVHSSDPRYTFDLAVAMSARVEDPLAFLQDFGPKASVFDAFYDELLEDIARELSNCPIDDLVETQRRLSDYARDLERDQPFYKGVRIMQFNVTVNYGDQLKKKIEEYEVRRGLHAEGEDFLIIDGAINPANRERNEQIKTGLRESNEYKYKKSTEQARDAMQLAQEYAEMAGLEVRKVARDVGLDRRVKEALEPQAKRAAPDKTLLFSSKSAEDGAGQDRIAKRADGQEE